MSEVGSGQVAIFPTFKGFRSKVDSEAGSAGRSSGRTFSSAFNVGAGDPGEALVKKLNAQIASGSNALSKARLAEQDAAGKVRAAESALTEARAKGGAESSRAIAAEERLASAQRKAAEASTRTKSASDQLRASQAKLAEATSAAGASGEQSAGRFASGWATLKGKVSGVARGAVADAGDSAAAAADSAGRESGNRFASGFKGVMGPALALAGAVGFSGLIAEAAAASDATDKFKATMNFAGLDSSAITEATAAAKDFADQTVYDLPTIQSTIAQLASNGVSDYTGLTKAAGNLNAVAGGNADTFKSVAMVMTQTAGAGKLTTENWNQMADAIPGASGPLMKALEEAGAYTGNFRDAMAEGEISADEFNAALMKLGTDPVAVEAAKSTKTFEGAIGGLTATINSGLMSALDAMKPTITGAINLVSGGLGKAFDFIGSAWTGLGDLFARGDFSSSLREAFNVEEDSRFVDFLFDAREAAINLWSGLSMGSDVRAQFTGQLSGIIGFGAKVREVFDGIVTTAKTLWAGFTMPPEVAAGFGANLNPILAIGASLRSVFDAIAPAVSGLIPQIVGLWTAVSPLQIIFSAIQPLLPQLLGMFGQLASTLGGTLTTVLTSLVPMLMQLSAVISQALGTVLAAVLPAAVQMITLLGDTFTQLMPVLLPIIGTIIQLAATLISQLAPIITELISSILPPVVSIFGNILGAIMPLISTIAGLLIPIIAALLPVVVTVFNVIADVIKSAMQIIQGVIEVVTGVITGNWAQVWSGILNIVGGVFDLVVNLISGAIQLVMSVILNGLNAVFGFWSSMWSGIVSYLGTSVRSIISGAEGMLSDLLGFFGGIGNNIMGALGNIGGLLLDSGRSLIQGFIDGISGMIGSVGDAVGGVLEAAREFFPFSPAKRGPFSGRGYTSYSGKALAKDFAGGISSEQSTVAGAAARLMSSASLSLNPAVAGAAGAAAGFGAGQTNNITINQVDDPVGTSHAVVRRVAALGA